MKFLKTVGLGLLGIIILLAVVGFFLPQTQHLERSITINADQQAIFTTLNSFESFNEWSPWAELDPNASYQYSGPASGVGAGMSWTSDEPNVGNGSQKIISSEPFNRVQVELIFGDNDVTTASYTLAPVDGGVEVTWGFDADFGNNIMGRYFGLLLEKFLGPQYEQGLANLKTLMEK